MVDLLRKLWRAYKGCNRGDHNWFPGEGPREFVPVTNTCLRCTAQQTYLPYGDCLGAHPLREHYDDRGQLIPHPTCVGPR